MIVDTTYKTVAEKLLKNYIAPYGIPKQIRTDPGTRFTNKQNYYLETKKIELIRNLVRIANGPKGGREIAVRKIIGTETEYRKERIVERIKNVSP